jgi:signal transduction histidine kinase/CheY-like chemotaxis protein
MDLLMVAGTNRNSVLGYIVAIVMVSFALLLRLAAGDLFSDFPYLLFFIPVIVASFFGGIGPGALAIVLSAAAVHFSHVGPGGPLLPVDASQWTGLVVFVLSAGLLSALIDGLLFALRRQGDLQNRLLEFNANLDKLLEERTDALKIEMSEHAVAQAQLRQVQKLETIAQLTGGLAHDFNNLLAVIVGSLDLAERRIAKGLVDESRQCIGNAKEGARRAAQLTARLLAFSRQQPLTPEVLDVNQVIGIMADPLRRLLGADITIETTLPGGLWTTSVDRQQLENTILNLAMNAREAMNPGGKLTIETANAEVDGQSTRESQEMRPGQYVKVTITDTGTGMAADAVERAFDPFYTTKGPGGGAGLGLSQVFGYVKQSGGHVELRSQPGTGTSVTFYLPRYAGKDAPKIITVPEKPGLPKATRHEIVLVVEDEDNVRHMTVEALRELGYSVIEASGGRDALQQLANHPHIDLLFTDIVMPGMNGKMVADAVKDRHPGIKVIFTTGYTRNAIVHNGVVEPGINLLTKPFTLEQLAVKLSDVLKRP